MGLAHDGRYKTIDEPNSTTTLDDVDELEFEVEANKQRARQ